MPINPTLSPERQPSLEGLAVSQYTHGVVNPAVEYAVSVINAALPDVDPVQATVSVHPANPIVINEQQRQTTPTDHARQAVYDAYRS